MTPDAGFVAMGVLACSPSVQTPYLYAVGSLTTPCSSTLLPVSHSWQTSHLAHFQDGFQVVLPHSKMATWGSFFPNQGWPPCELCPLHLFSIMQHLAFSSTIATRMHTGTQCSCSPSERSCNTQLMRPFTDNFQK